MEEEKARRSHNLSASQWEAVTSTAAALTDSALLVETLTLPNLVSFTATYIHTYIH